MNAQDLYTRIGKVSKKEEQTLSLEECLKLKAQRGACKFERKVLRFWSKETIKDSEEIASILYDLGMVSSEDEGREVLPLLEGRFEYQPDGIIFKDTKYLFEVKLFSASDGETMYRIRSLIEF